MPDELSRQIGARVRALRTDRRLTLDVLSGRCGILPEVISRLERGSHTPSLTTLNKLAKGLQVPLVLLLVDAQEMSMQEALPPEVLQLAFKMAAFPPDTFSKAQRIIAILAE